MEVIMKTRWNDKNLILELAQKPRENGRPAYVVLMIN